jgi:hypothetical protein
MESRRVLAKTLGPEGIMKLRDVWASSPDDDALQPIRERLGETDARRLHQMLEARNALSLRLSDASMADLHRLVLSPEDLDDRLKLILALLTEAQRTHLAAFVEARPLLIARHGLVGFAEIMDRFAACERQVNRAWSAAADNVYEESVECLDLGAELLEETINRLRQSPQSAAV